MATVIPPSGKDDLARALAEIEELKRRERERLAAERARWHYAKLGAVALVLSAASYVAYTVMMTYFFDVLEFFALEILTVTVITSGSYLLGWWHGRAGRFGPPKARP